MISQFIIGVTVLTLLYLLLTVANVRAHILENMGHPCLLQHDAKPIDVCPVFDGLQIYFIDKNGGHPGPVIPNVGELNEDYYLRDTFFLWNGDTMNLIGNVYWGGTVNPISKKPILWMYVRNEHRIRIFTLYENRHTGMDKPYVFSIIEDIIIVHEEW